jgi:transcriptional regulator with XRE-family HTH domain
MSKSETFSINKKVSALLVTERKDRELTQAQVATKLKKPQSFVSKYESGQRQLTVADLIAICKAIGLKPSQFFKLFD